MSRRRRRERKKGIMNRRQGTKDEDSSSDSDSNSSSSMSATTLPNLNATRWPRVDWRNGRRTHRPRTTLSFLIDRSTASSTRSRTTGHLTRFSGTSRHPDMNTGHSNNMVGTDSTSLILSATLASLGVIVLVLIVLIAYFAYFRKRRWGSHNSLNSSGSEIRVIEGISNIGYHQHGAKGKKGDRLSIIPECAEELEYEYVDPDKCSINRISNITNSSGINEYEYVDPDQSNTNTHNNSVRVSDQISDYEYVDPDSSNIHKLGSSPQPQTTITIEDDEYVDPDTAAFTRPNSTGEGASAYQSMVPSGLDQHFYADRTEYPPNYGTGAEAEDNSSEYAVIGPENSTSENQSADNPVYHGNS